MKGQPRVALVAAGAVALVVLAVDLAIPLGVALGVGYVVVIMLTPSDASDRSVVALAVVSTFLLGVGYVWSLKHGSGWQVTANRILSTSAIWTVAWGLLRRNQRAREMKRERDAIARHLGMFFDLSNDLMCLVTPDGVFQDANAAFARVLGYSRTELSARTWQDLVHPDDLMSTRTAMEALDQGQPRVAFENRIVHRDGSIRKLFWCVATAEDLLCATARDVTGTDIAGGWEDTPNSTDRADVIGPR